MDKAIRSQLITGSDNPDHSQRLVVEVDKYTNTAEKLAMLDNLYTHGREQEWDILTEQGSQNGSDKATNNQLRRFNCGKVLESSNKKHLLCEDCFEKTKSKACACGKKFVPTLYCCFKFSKDKSKAAPAESKQLTVDHTETTMFTTTVADSEIKLRRPRITKYWHTLK